MAYPNQIKCINCGKSIPPMPEDATEDELMCDECLAKEEQEQSIQEDDFL